MKSGMLVLLALAVLCVLPTGSSCRKPVKTDISAGTNTKDSSGPAMEAGSAASASAKGNETAQGIDINGSELLTRNFVPYGPPLPGSEQPPLTATATLDPEAAAARRTALAYLTGSGGHYDLESASRLFDELADKGDPYSIMYRAVIRRYYYKQGSYELPADFKEASLNTIDELADQRDPEAMYLLARYIYTFRYPNTADFIFELARNSADSGFAPAATFLGYLYSTTLNDGPDYDKAAEWLSRAAHSDQADAMYQLGYLHGQSDWPAHDPEESVMWFERSAEREYPFAYWALGYCYESGTGVRQDYGKAAKWYDRGAGVGNAESLYSLGLLYARGLGVEQDPGRARELFEAALAAGEQRAQVELDRLRGAG
jgi:TPR repeat protein